MPVNHTSKLDGIDPREVKVHFSPEVKAAFSDLAAAVHFSDSFDGDVLSILQDWAAGKTHSIHDVLTSLPLIAEETNDHIRKSGDKRAEEAWRELCLQMPENGFSLTRERAKTK